LLRGLVVLADAAAERAANAGAVGFGEEGGILRAVGQRGDLLEPRADRREPLGLDRAGVEIGRVGAADLRIRVLCGGVENAAGAALGQVGEEVERAVVRLVGRDRGVLRPVAVGVVVEIVAGLDLSMPFSSKPNVPYCAPVEVAGAGGAGSAVCEMAAVTPVMAVAASRPATMKDFMFLSRLRHPDESQDPEPAALLAWLWILGRAQDDGALWNGVSYQIRTRLAGVR
jgi:hypothetical protein